jgi:hypothetical protein
VVAKKAGIKEKGRRDYTAVADLDVQPLATVPGGIFILGLATVQVNMNGTAVIRPLFQLHLFTLRNK